MPKVTAPPRPPPVRREGAGSARGRRAGLERTHIAGAALALLDSDGLDAVSTRRIAERLGVRSAALYWHVRDKRELLALAADALCADMALPPAALSARERLRAIADEYRRILLAHRDAARLFAELPPLGPHRLRLYDAAVGAFLDAGFAAGTAAAMATFYRNTLLGMIGEEARQTRADPSSQTPNAAVAATLASLGDEAAAAYPHLHRVADRLADIQPAAMFELGIGLLLDGITGAATPSPKDSGASPRPAPRPR